MDKTELMSYISNELKHGRNVDFEYKINGIPYKIKVLASDIEKGINIPKRKLLGTEMFNRAEKSIQILRKIGIDINHEIIQGRTHNNRSGIGVNELGDKYIKNTYNNTIKNKLIDNDFSR